jgi:hypothetical protein
LSAAKRKAKAKIRIPTKPIEKQYVLQLNGKYKRIYGEKELKRVPKLPLKWRKITFDDLTKNLFDLKIIEKEELRKNLKQ